MGINGMRDLDETVTAALRGKGMIGAPVEFPTRVNAGDSHG